MNAILLKSRLVKRGSMCKIGKEGHEGFVSGIILLWFLSVRWKSKSRLSLSERILLLGTNRLDGYSAYDDIAAPERIRRWHPLNQSLYMSYQIMMPGLLMAAKGDRSTRFSATEGRYPFLDERVVAFCAELARITSCGAGRTNICCAAWPRACCRRRSPSEAKPCSAPTWGGLSWPQIGRAGSISFSAPKR
ncbi:MAG TPA: asparagine synthase-related protein [Gemmataceae bacterium]|nr:asparagine synthase-related protein [Gemmataceae bacterium]